MSANHDLSSTIKLGKGGSMTLRNKTHLTRVRIFADPGPEEFYAPPHWHERHNELFRIMHGQLEVLIGTKKHFYLPEDGEICIPRRTIHSLRVVKGEECIHEERTDPMDDQKELLFRNAFANAMHVPGFLSIMQIMYHGDTRPGFFLLGVRWVEALLVNFVGNYVAPFFWLQALRAEHQKIYLSSTG